jgi:hypothetical protein
MKLMVAMILGTVGGACFIFLFGRLLAFDQKNIEVDVDVDFFVPHHLLKNMLVVGHRRGYRVDLGVASL